MVNQQAQHAVQQSLDSVTSKSQETGVAGLVFVAADKNGDDIAAVASGTRGLGTSEPMTLDTSFWIASCTKLLTAIACMQAVEDGKLKLDDAQQVYHFCPELRDVKVLQDDGSLVEKKKDITLRMLLSHTAGFGYEFFNPKLAKHGRPVGYDVFHADIGDIIRMPLVNQPGTKFEYGINIDWAGILLERASGNRLNDWIQDRILKPLHLSKITMFPTDDMKANLAYMHQRWPGSPEAQVRDHMYREPLLASTAEEKARIFQSGGAGAFAQPKEYVQVLVALVNNGTHPKTGAQILKPETVEAMWQNQIPNEPDFARAGIPASKPEQTNPLPDIYPQQGDPPQGWGISFMLTVAPGATGRGKNTAFWAGIANLFWWVDREKGVAGMIAAQVMPFGDMQVLGQWIACESAVYAALGT